MNTKAFSTLTMLVFLLFLHTNCGYAEDQQQGKIAVQSQTQQQQQSTASQPDPLNPDSWEPMVDEWETTMQKLNRMIQRGRERWEQGFPEDSFVGFGPSIDITEDGTNYILKADLPGMSKDKISLDVTDRTVTLSGVRDAEKEFQQGGVQRIERSFGEFKRTVSLPGPVLVEKVSADYKEGVLTVILPKMPAVQPKSVKVSVR